MSRERHPHRGARGASPGGFGSPALQRKDAQLCAQVSEELGLALAAEGDEALNGAWIMSVEPWPTVGQLRVVVQAPQGVDPDALLEKLQANSAYLRGEIADSIHRKKVPSLSFVVVPAPESPAPLE